MKFRFSASALLLLFTSGAYASDRGLTSVIRGTEGNEDIFGLAQITEGPDGTVQVEVEVVGLPDGHHGIHFHTYGDEVGANDGTAAGGHYNPGEVDHAGPQDAVRHVADLGNINSVYGKASYSRTFDPSDNSRPAIVSDFMNSVIGRGIIIHRDADDFVSQPTGNAGPRLAIGVVGIANEELAPGTLEVTEHIMSEDFAPPKALVCKIRGEGIAGTGVARYCNGAVELSATATGLSEGAHGMHIHWYGEEYEFSDMPMMEDRDLGRAGGHYNPTGAMHDLPGSNPRHYGDAGNMIVKDGVGTLMATVPDVPDLRSWVGRTCLIHEDPDDGGQPAGNAGPRIAAGQLGFANPDTVEACQPISSEAALCGYIEKLEKLGRAYEKNSSIRRKGLMKLNGAIHSAKKGKVVASLDRLRAAARFAEAAKATYLAKTAASHARYLANTLISQVKGVIGNDTIESAESRVKAGNALFRDKDYSGAIALYRGAARAIVASDYFPSRILSRPNCP